MVRSWRSVSPLLGKEIDKNVYLHAINYLQKQGKYWMHIKIVTYIYLKNHNAKQRNLRNNQICTKQMFYKINQRPRKSTNDNGNQNPCTYQILKFLFQICKLKPKTKVKFFIFPSYSFLPFYFLKIESYGKIINLICI